MTIKERFLKNIQQEAKEYNDYLMSLPKDEIILHSYETYVKKELLWFFEEEISNDYNDLTTEEYIKLIKLKEEAYEEKNKMLEYLFNDISASDHSPVDNYCTTLGYIRYLIQRIEL